MHRFWSGKRPTCPQSKGCAFIGNYAVIGNWDTTLCHIIQPPFLVLPLLNLSLAMPAQFHTPSWLSSDLVLLQVPCLKFTLFFPPKKLHEGFLFLPWGVWWLYCPKTRLQSFLPENVWVGRDGGWLWDMMVVPSPVGKAIVFSQGFGQAKPVGQVLFYCMLPDTGIDSSLETGEG